MERKCKRCGKPVTGIASAIWCSKYCRAKASFDRRKPKFLEYREANRELGILWGAKNRAKRLNVPFNLTIEDIVIPEMCPILNIPVHRKIGLSHNTASLDRIIPELGYVKGNVWVISQRANRVKTNLSRKELILLCFNLLKKIEPSLLK
jgi:hypothetical protein